MTAQPGDGDQPTEPGYHGLVLCGECDGQQSMPDCKCEGVGWMLHGKPTTEEAEKKAFGAMYAARMDRQRTAIPARFAFIEAAHRKVAAALGNDDPRVTELIGMVRLLLPSPASGWQDERPGIGNYLVSLAPAQRHWVCNRAVMRAVVAEIEGELWVMLKPTGPLILTAPLFTGTKWKRRALEAPSVPADPFMSEVRDGK